MNTFLLATLSLPFSSLPCADSSLEKMMPAIQSIEQKQDGNLWTQVTLADLLPGDFLLFGSSENEWSQIGIYLGHDQWMPLFSQEASSATQALSLGDLLDQFPYFMAFRLNESHFTETIDEQMIESEERQGIDSIETISVEIPSFLHTQFDCYFVNEQHMPLVISPKDPSASLSSFQVWAETHQEELKSFLATNGALLLRNFPIEKAEEFASVIRSIVGRDLLDYRGGEGSRKKVADGVYTSTEAPPQFKIPLHNELSCTNNPAAYICFYCDVAPTAGTGQTILGLTEQITQEVLKHPTLWNFFNGHNIRYISRHPPEGSFFNKVNVTHKTWPQVFETHDREKVEQICKEKDLEYKWIGDWIEVSRLVPAIKGPDHYFDHPYWFNQLHLYHANPRIRGGWINHILANLLYISPSTRQYDVELEDGTSIPRAIVYEIYDILDQKTIKFDWQKGDALILDNIKALHGRAPCVGQRRILVSMVP